MRFFSSSLISFLINIGLLSFLLAMAKKQEIKPYKVYKIDIVKIEEEKKIVPKKKVVFPKKETPQPPKEEPKPIPLSVPEIKDEIAPIEDTKINTDIPIFQEEDKEQDAPIFQEEDKGEEIYDANKLDEPLKIISSIMPKYPPLARENEIEGLVKIKLLIDPSGLVKNIEVISEEPKGFGFKDEVLKVVWNYRFSQPRVSKKPVSVYCILPLRFSLED